MRSENPAGHALPVPGAGEWPLQTAWRAKHRSKNRKGQGENCSCSSPSMGGVSPQSQTRLSTRFSSDRGRNDSGARAGATGCQYDLSQLPDERTASGRLSGWKAAKAISLGAGEKQRFLRRKQKVASKAEPHPHPHARGIWHWLGGSGKGLRIPAIAISTQTFTASS